MSDDRIWGEADDNGPARAARTVRVPDPLCAECSRLRIEADNARKWTRRDTVYLQHARSVIRALIGADGLTGGLGDLTMPDGTPLVDAVRAALGETRQETHEKGHARG